MAMNLDDLIARLCELRRQHSNLGRCHAFMELETPAGKTFIAQLDEVKVRINTASTYITMHSEEKAERIDA